MIEVLICLITCSLLLNIGLLYWAGTLSKYIEALVAIDEVESSLDPIYHVITWAAEGVSKGYIGEELAASVIDDACYKIKFEGIEDGQGIVQRKDVETNKHRC